MLSLTVQEPSPDSFFLPQSEVNPPFAESELYRRFISLSSFLHKNELASHHEHNADDGWTIHRKEIILLSKRVSHINNQEVDFSFSYIPKTPLGERLIALRRKALEDGLDLLDAEEVLFEVKSRRGEVDGS